MQPIGIKTDVKKAEPRSVVNSIFLGCDSGHAKTTGSDHWVNPPRFIKKETNTTLGAVPDGSRFIRKEITPYYSKSASCISASTNHVHYNEIQQYSEDAKKHHNPCELWEVEVSAGVWVTCVLEPMWYYDSKYRRKDYFSLSNLCKDQVNRYKEPQTIDINGYNVPKPLTKEEGEKLGKVFVVTLDSIIPCSVAYGSLCRKGLLHSTLEAAELHRKALLSFTKKD
jgi:hypothetical protein